MAGSFVPNPTEINNLLHGPAGPVYQFMARFGRSVETRAKRLALVDHGTLRDSIRSTPPDFGPGGLTLTVGSNVKQAIIIHQGHREMTTPTKGGKSFYRFQPKDLRGSGKFVYARKIRAVGGYPFLTAALKEANDALPGPDRFRITITKPPLPGAPPRGARAL